MEFMRWALVGIIGVITGIVAFLISMADKYLNQFKLSVFEKCTTVHSYNLNNKETVHRLLCYHHN